MHLKLNILAVLALLILFSATQISHAQVSTLPDGWCGQPSTEQWTTVNGMYTNTRTVGNSEGGIRALYQSYSNRVVLQRTDPRELVQVLEENVTFSDFDPIRYTDNCRYLIVNVRDTERQSSVVVYDLLSTTPVRMGTIANAGRNRSNVESSPEGRYLLVTAMDGLYLWDLNANTQTYLTALMRSDCELAGVVGCSGEINTYREARWDVPHGLLQLDLVSSYTVTLELRSATIKNVEATPIYVYSIRTASLEQLNNAAAAFSSTYACQPRVQYQAYNHRVVMVERYAHQLVAVVEENLDLSGFQFLGWSPTCSYIVAAIEDENGLRLAAWNVNTMARQEHTITDWVDRSTWLTSSDSINIVTDGGTFDWNLSQIH